MERIRLVFTTLMLISSSLVYAEHASRRPPIQPDPRFSRGLSTTMMQDHFFERAEHLYYVGWDQSLNQVKSRFHLDGMPLAVKIHELASGAGDLDLRENFKGRSVEEIYQLIEADKLRASTSAPNWLGPASTQGLPLADCVTEARKIGNTFRYYDRRLWAEPDKTIEKICTPDVLRKQQAYNESLKSYAETKHLAENFHLFLSMTLEQMGRNAKVFQEYERLDAILFNEEGKAVSLPKLLPEYVALKKQAAEAAINTAALFRSLTDRIRPYLMASPVPELQGLFTSQLLSLQKLSRALPSRSENTAGAVPAGGALSQIVAATDVSAHSLSSVLPDTTLRWSPNGGPSIIIQPSPTNVGDTFRAGRQRDEYRANVHAQFDKKLQEGSRRFAAGKNSVAKEYRTSEPLTRAKTLLGQVKIPSQDSVSHAGDLSPLFQPPSAPSEQVNSSKAYQVTCSSPGCEQLRKTFNSLATAQPFNQLAQNAQGIGLGAAIEADHAFSAGDVESGRTYSAIAVGMADLALGFVPVLGTVKFGYEAISGKSLLTGKPLTSTERAFALVGAVAGGFASWKLLKPAVMELGGIVAASTSEAEVALSRAEKILDSAASLGESNPELGRKLDYILGKATGSPHNVERSREMLRQMESIGLHDSPGTRAYLAGHLKQALSDPSSVLRIQEDGRVVRESMLSGPRGLVKIESIWEGNKLITVKIYGR